MTDEELERLARLIAAEITRTLPDGRGTGAASVPVSWLPEPVRPTLAPRPSDPPPWSGAAQALGDVAPIREPVPSAHRADPGAMAAATRAAAAGAAPPRKATGRGPAVGEPSARPASRGRRPTARPGFQVPVGVSNRHVHLSESDTSRLFGRVALTSDRAISQPGQFAATERVTLVGPLGKVENVRVVGPARPDTQVELSHSDARRLGVTPAVLASGQVRGSGGGITLEGPAGSVRLERGVIVAERHLHVGSADAARLGLRDGDLLAVRAGVGGRAATLHGVLVRAGPTHATELHLDADEAAALGVVTGDTATVVAYEVAPARRRPLLTERDVVALAATGGAIPPGALLTPSARDRARSLGIPLP